MCLSAKEWEPGFLERPTLHKRDVVPRAYPVDSRRLRGAQEHIP